MAYDWGDGKGRVHSVPLEQHLQAQGKVPAAPQKGIPQGAAAPQASPTAPAPAPASGGAAPFTPDAAYLANAAQEAFNRQTQINQYNLQQQQERAAADQAIQRLVQQAPQDRQNINQGANRAGLFYSGQLTKQLGDYETKLQQQQDDINTDYKNRQDARQQAIDAINAGAPLQDAVDLASAADRQVARDTTAADNNALTLNPGATSTPLQAAAAAHVAAHGANVGQSYTTQPAVGGVWHVYPNGKRVFVKK